MDPHHGRPLSCVEQWSAFPGKPRFSAMTKLDAVEVGPQPLKASVRAFDHPVARFLGRRLLGAVATLFVVAVVIFLALQVIPGDAATTVLGRNATPASLHELRHQLKLDRPLTAQFFGWLGGLLHGDFGNSASALAHNNGDPSVWTAIREPLVNSAYLAGIAVVLLIPLGLLLGALAAVRQGRPSDYAVSVTALVFGGMPEFLVGTILIAVFFSWLNLLPPIANIGPGETPLAHPSALVLPVVTLLAVSLGFTIRMVRAGTIEALHQDYVAMARLNGIRESRVVFRYALRNSLAPSVQAIAQTVAYFAGGIIITESVFDYPGIGRLLVQAVNARDVPTIADITMLLATFYVLVNVLADLVVVALVPKLRTSL
jgi:peptide/nickel transport system permease protein